MVRDRDPFTKAEGQDPRPPVPTTTEAPGAGTTPAPARETAAEALDTTTVLPATGPAAARTAEVPRTAEAPRTAGVPQAAGVAQAAEMAPAPGTADGPKGSGASRRLEVPWLTLLLAVAIVATLAFIAGVLVERHQLS
ncbi:hypothetical protein ACFYM2_10195 [Streptomyces sp. NPDC006711]|uniref:hypothetical protein n=1 Tax=Streptomyces sp. NPDC006711 TaxID=3364762 RepID=UPI003698CA2D